MTTLLGAMLLLVGPCQLVQGGLRQREDAALIKQGVEVTAKVVSLTDGEALKGGAPRVGGDSCRWVVEVEGQRCSQVFALPCPDGVTETPALIMPNDPSLCRVLNRQALTEDGQARQRMVMGGGLSVVAVVLLVLRRRFRRRPQVGLEA